jgi:hypothetical protein
MSDNSFASRARASQSNSIQSILDGNNKENSTHSASNINDFTKKFNQDEISKKYAHVDPAKKAKSDLIYLVKGVDAGRNAWYYVLVERVKLQLFLKALNDDIIHLENYGVILYSAYGDEPPANITDALKEEYGIED